MRFKQLGISVLTIAASISLSGCFTERITDKIGGELSGEEFAQRFTEIDSEVESGFAKLGGLLQPSSLDRPLGSELRDVAQAGVDAALKAANDLDDLNPPDDAEEAVDELVASARGLAAAGQEVLDDPEATGAELIDAFQANDSSDAVDQIRALGYAPPDSKR